MTMKDSRKESNEHRNEGQQSQACRGDSRETTGEKGEGKGMSTNSATWFSASHTTGAYVAQSNNTSDGL